MRIFFLPMILLAPFGTQAAELPQAGPLFDAILQSLRAGVVPRLNAAELMSPVVNCESEVN